MTPFLRRMRPMRWALLLLMAVGALYGLTACVADDAPTLPVQGRLGGIGEQPPETAGVPRFTGPLTVTTLNLAHGRGTGFSQLFQSGDTAQDNLMRASRLLERIGADIVALQEADGPSRWSGDFDHVATLADAAGFSWYARATHVSNWFGTYGTAMLSRRPFVEAVGHTFEPSPPTFNKGFLLGRFSWQPDIASDTVLYVDIVSVHLDFSRRSVRRGQIEEMAAVLAGRNNPLIILGDFNSEWLADASVVKTLANQAGLTVYRPQATDLGTFNDGQKRLDWILISRDLAFVRYTLAPEVVSDHLAVIAEIKLDKKLPSY
jgi:endonuclease/exonuclease/phosphatase family metal-dependent hydrolase